MLAVTTDVVVKATAIAINPVAAKAKSINCSQPCKPMPNTLRLTFLSVLGAFAIDIVAITMSK